MRVYADTNFFTNSLLKLPFSQEAERLVADLGKADVVLPVPVLLRLEVTGALQHLVFESRTGSQALCVTPEMALTAEAFFISEVEAGILMRECNLPESALIAQFSDLVHRYTAKHGFRTYDTLHVASALILGCDTFWTFDVRTKKLATLEGLKTNGP